MKFIALKRIFIGFPWPLVAAAALAQATDRMPVSEVRTLLVAAIDSPTGEASGVLTGDLADAITRRFEAASPIYIDVITARRYAQAGCSRLNVKIWQEGVRLPGASAPKKQTLEIGINYCRDGLPPRSLT